MENQQLQQQQNQPIPQQQQQQQQAQQVQSQQQQQQFNNSQYPLHQQQKTGGIRISNLHPAITEEFVFLELITQKINKATNIQIKKKFDQCLGYGFIYYENQNLTEEARQKLIGEKWLGKRIQVSMVIPNFKDLDKQNNNIYVSNVDTKVLPKEFYNFFTRFGPIYSSNLKLAENQEENMGYGQVFFENISEAEQCLKECANQALKLGEKQVKVSRFQPYNQRNHQKNNIYLKDYHKEYNEGDLKNDKFIDEEKEKIKEELKKFIQDLDKCKSFAVKFNQKFKKPQAFICYEDHQIAEQVLDQIKGFKDKFPFRYIDYVKTQKEIFNMMQNKIPDPTILFMKNLKADVSQEQIKKQFDDKAYKTVFCNVKEPTEPKFKNSKYCIIKFEIQHDADKALINLKNLNSMSINPKNDLLDIKEIFLSQYKIYVNKLIPKNLRQQYNNLKKPQYSLNLNNQNPGGQQFYMNNQNSFQPLNQNNNYGGFVGDMSAQNLLFQPYSQFMMPPFFQQNLAAAMPMPGMGLPSGQNQRMTQKNNFYQGMNKQPMYNNQFQQQYQQQQQVVGGFNQQKFPQMRPQSMNTGNNYNNRYQGYQQQNDMRNKFNKGNYMHQYNNQNIHNKQQYQQFPNNHNNNYQGQRNNRKPGMKSLEKNISIPQQQLQQQQQQQQAQNIPQQNNDNKVEEEKNALLASWQTLVIASNDEQKNKIGQVLFPLVQKNCQNTNNAPKITGMLLDFSVFDLSDMKLFLENYEHLKEQIKEAEEMLKQTNAINSQTK